MNEGVTVVICLTPDCPLVTGTAYVEEIVGIGGWSDDSLERLKETMNRKINRGQFCCSSDEDCSGGGPIISIMNMLVFELEKMKKPDTPTLPLRKKL